MGRLFWKFFFFIWLAQLTAIFGIGGAVWLKNRSQEKSGAAIDMSPPAALLVESASVALRYGGTPALRGLIGEMGHHPVYAVDENGRDLLGRQTAPGMVAAARRALGQEFRPQRVRQAMADDGHVYLLFVPWEGRPGGGPFPAGERPPPPRDDHFLPLLPLASAMMASLIFAALLAWYFAKPIRLLRSAFESAAEGNLAVRLEPVMGQRRDELADLGRDFDRMAGRLRSLLDGQRRLLHDVSHELRSPLARLQAAVGLARQQPDRLEASLERIERETIRMDSLLDELLTLSRLEAGVMGDMAEVFQVEELLADIIADARFEAEAMGRVVEFAGMCPAVATGRPELLHRAIENVVRNAVKHTPAGGRVSVDAGLDAQGDEVLIAIADQGPGVPEEEREAIFEPFFRGGEVRDTSGHGLGLSIARHVVEAHGGAIRAFNGARGGLCVEIRLPLRRRVDRPGSMG